MLVTNERRAGKHIAFTKASAQDFIEALAATDPDTPGERFQFAIVEASSGTHIGDLAAFVDEADLRLAKI
jgi:hypothetical protein